jgi:hypothetical protein
MPFGLDIMLALVQVGNGFTVRTQGRSAAGNGPELTSTTFQSKLEEVASANNRNIWPDQSIVS